MKQLLLATTLSLSLIASPSILATPKPEKCPGVAALQSIKFEVTDNSDGIWAAGVLRNNYDTQDTWTFVMEGFEAKNSEDALNVANSALKSLSFKDGPMAIEEYDMWLCEYDTAEGYQAFAYTPAYQGNVNHSLMSFRK